MKNKMWIIMTLLLVLPGFMLTVACQKKVAVQQQPVAVEEKEEPVAEKKEEPVVVPKDTKLDAMVMEEDIHFDFDKYNLTPTAQKPIVPIEKSIRFFMMMLTAFFARVNPVSTIAKPACMKKTRNAARQVH